MLRLPRPRLRQPGPVRGIVRRLTFIVTALVLINLLTLRYRVEGPSMQPTLADGDIVLLNRVAYQFSPPVRGDIVIVHRPDLSQQDLIKRVIGLPGETVEFRDGAILINGQLYEAACAGCGDGVWVLDVESYFLLGDQREDSRDSRAFGPIARETLLGKVLWRYWPLEQFGPLP